MKSGLAAPGAEQARSETLWQQYALHVDLYKFYLDLALKTNALFYGITGAILTYYFAHPGAQLIKYSLSC
jgi:hypothetical protein